MAEIVTVDDIAVWDADLRSLTDGPGLAVHRPEPRATFGLMVAAVDTPKIAEIQYVILCTPEPESVTRQTAIPASGGLRERSCLLRTEGPVVDYGRT
jgi:hypothetical protein